jgi:hypothetical protein
MYDTTRSTFVVMGFVKTVLSLRRETNGIFNTGSERPCRRLGVTISTIKQESCCYKSNCIFAKRDKGLISVVKDKAVRQLFLAAMLSAEIHVVSIFWSSIRDEFIVPFSI